MKNFENIVKTVNTNIFYQNFNCYEIHIMDY